MNFEKQVAINGENYNGYYLVDKDSIRYFQRTNWFK